jgi:hypothetical protein
VPFFIPVTKNQTNVSAIIVPDAVSGQFDIIVVFFERKPQTNKERKIMKKVMLKKYECDVIVPTNRKEKKMSSKIGLKDMIAVPIRQNGLSSKGIKLRCLQNVANMVAQYGGQMMIGMIYRKGNKSVERCFVKHAVWITPEGKAVCITKKNYTIDPSFKHKDGKRCVGLYPTKVYSQEDVLKMLDPTKKQPVQWKVNVVYPSKRRSGLYEIPVKSGFLEVKLPTAKQAIMSEEVCFNMGNIAQVHNFLKTAA